MDRHSVFLLLSRHVNLIKDFGRYERRARADSADGSGLVDLQVLLSEILEMSPTGYLNANAVKAGLLDMVVKQPSVNVSPYNNQVWAGLRCERLTTIMNHVRRLSREGPRLRQAMATLTAKDSQVLKDLIGLVQAESTRLDADDDHATRYYPTEEEKKNRVSAEPLSGAGGAMGRARGM